MDKIMIFKELLGETARIKILEEMLDYSDEYLSIDEISTMAEVPNKTVHNTWKNRILRIIMY